MDTKTDTKSALSNLAQLSRAQEIESMQMPQQSGGLVTIDMIPAQIVPVKRDLKGIMANIKVLAEVAGEDYYYSFPAKQKIVDEETGKETWVDAPIEGPSIKLANDLAREYGNCGVRMRVEDNGKSWTFYALFFDLERGYTLERPFQQRKDQKTMGAKSRAEDIAFQIGASKAIRNVVVNALETFSNFMMDAAKQSLADKVGAKLEFYRGKVVERLGEMAIDLRRVEPIVGRKSNEWRVGDVVKLISQLKAIQDGMVGANDVFPPLDQYQDKEGEPDAKAKTRDELREDGRTNDRPRGADQSASNQGAQGGVGQQDGAKPVDASAAGGVDAGKAKTETGDEPSAASTAIRSDNGGSDQRRDSAAGDGSSVASPGAGEAEAGRTNDDPPTADPEELSPTLLSLLKDLQECGSSSRAQLLEREAKDNLDANEFEVFSRSFKRRMDQFTARKRQTGSTKS